MFRWLWYLVILGAVAVGAVWLADNPGSVTLVWQEYRVDTSVALLLAVVAAVSVLTAFSYRVWLFFRRLPASLERVRLEGRRRRGYLALTRGMVAVAAGDGEGAQKQVKKAEVLLGDPALTLLLSAQAAQLAGDETAAGRFFRQMLDRPETEFLGVRGLLTQAMKRGDRDEALVQAKEAHRLRPESGWVAQNLFDLQTAAGHWSQARKTLAGAMSNKGVGGGEARRPAGVVDHMQSLQAAADGESARALKLAHKAHKQDAALIPAAARLAGLLTKAGKKKKAAAVIESTWRVNPHPDLVQPYAAAHGATDALKTASAMERLASFNPDSDESHLAVAGAALDARLWGEARKHLRVVADGEPSSRVCRLMARLEELEHGDMESTHEWLVRASLGDPDPAWVCGHCGFAADAWSPLCGQCASFDSLDWRTPPRAAIALDSSRLESSGLASPGLTATVEKVGTESP